MKPYLFISIIFLSILFGCNSTNKKEIITVKEAKSKIINDELKEILPSLIQLQNLTFDNEGRLCIGVITTKEFVYLYLNSTGCAPSFTEKIGNYTVDFLIVPESINPARYFDFKPKKNDSDPKNHVVGCGVQPFLAVKFKRIDDDLKLEKISTFYDNSHFETFYDKSDSTFLNETGIIISEPEPIQPKQ